MLPAEQPPAAVKSAQRRRGGEHGRGASRSEAAASFVATLVSEPTINPIVIAPKAPAFTDSGIIQEKKKPAKLTGGLLLCIEVALLRHRF